jgi:ferrous iron transport protein B
MGAIRREMNSAKWTWIAITYQLAVGYVLSLLIYQFGSLFGEGSFGVGSVAAIVVLIAVLWLIFRHPKSNKAWMTHPHFHRGKAA